MRAMREVVGGHRSAGGGVSEPISVGDLVVVVKPTLCCGNPSRLGRTFVVKKIEFGPNRCHWCHTAIEDSDAFDGELWWTPRRLKRIPPLSELEGQPTQEDMKEPA